MGKPESRVGTMEMARWQGQKRRAFLERVLLLVTGALVTLGLLYVDSRGGRGRSSSRPATPAAARSRAPKSVPAACPKSQPVSRAGGVYTGCAAGWSAGLDQQRPGGRFQKAVPRRGWLTEPHRPGPPPGRPSSGSPRRRWDPRPRRTRASAAAALPKGPRGALSPPAEAGPRAPGFPGRLRRRRAGGRGRAGSQPEAGDSRACPCGRHGFWCTRAPGAVPPPGSDSGVSAEVLPRSQQRGVPDRVLERSLAGPWAHGRARLFLWARSRWAWGAPLPGRLPPDHVPGWSLLAAAASGPGVSCWGRRTLPTPWAGRGKGRRLHGAPRSPDPREPLAVQGYLSPKPLS